MPTVVRGLVAGFTLAVAWGAAHHVFGIPRPSPEQFLGVVVGIAALRVFVESLR
jgi:hypothetical protein